MQKHVKLFNPLVAYVLQTILDVIYTIHHYHWAIYNSRSKEIGLDTTDGLQNVGGR